MKKRLNDKNVLIFLIVILSISLILFNNSFIIGKIVGTGGELAPLLRESSSSSSSAGVVSCGWKGICNDTDANAVGIQASTTKGNIAYVTTANKIQTYEDSCIEKTINISRTVQKSMGFVKEWSCMGKKCSRPIPRSTEYMCLYGCQNGACISDPNGNKNENLKMLKGINEAYNFNFSNSELLNRWLSPEGETAIYTPCSDECKIFGQKACVGKKGPKSIVTCGNFDDDYCYENGNAVRCPASCRNTTSCA